MAKRVIAANLPDRSLPPLFLLGFRDDGARWTCRWTHSREYARWFDADEAETEAQLLGPYLSTGRILSAEPVSEPAGGTPLQRGYSDNN